MNTTKDWQQPSFAGGVRLVATREVQMRVRSKAFLWSTGILMLAILASIVIGSLVSQNASPPSVAVVGQASTSTIVTGAADAAAFEIEPASDRAAAEQLLRDGSVDAIIAPDTDDPLGLVVIGLDSAPTDVAMSLAVYPTVDVLEPDDTDPLLAYLVSFGFGIVFFMSAITFGSTISQSVIEEKQTRIVEILLSTISARALLAGKVLGNSVLALAQIVAIAMLAWLGLTLTGQQVAFAGLGPAIGWFVVFFAIGFVMLAALFAATSALVSRPEDAGSVTTPVTMLVMLPYFLVIFFNNNPLVLGIMSYVPFSAPVGMPVRVFLGEAAWWEPLVSLVLLAATTVAAVLVGERIYRGSLLKTGPRVKVSEALRG